jgi:hypothetical protein
MLRPKSVSSDSVIQDGVQMVNIMSKQWTKHARSPWPSLTEQFEPLAA